MTEIFHDDEFGEISLRRVSGATMRLKIAPSGKIILQLPRFASKIAARRFFDQSRDFLRENLNQKKYFDGKKIGKNHILKIRYGARNSLKIIGSEIRVILRKNLAKQEKTQFVKQAVAKALRSEAEKFLPRRLQFFALKFGFSYEKVRLTHAKTRWGSCSSSGTISLNIALMNLPDDQIDYVLLHELNHLKHMNHSREFWRDLEQICPHAHSKARRMKNFSPYL